MQKINSPRVRLPALILSGLLASGAAIADTSEPIIKVMPQYPRIAWVDRIEGNVQVQFNVSSQGVVENIRVVRASHPVFETNVIDAVSRYRFNPGAQRGVTETFRFTLAGNAADPEPVVTASES